MGSGTKNAAKINEPTLKFKILPYFSRCSIEILIYILLLWCQTLFVKVVLTIYVIKAIALWTLFFIVKLYFKYFFIIVTAIITFLCLKVDMLFPAPFKFKFCYFFLSFNK